MGDIVDIDANKEHIVQDVICLFCYHRWIDVRPVGCLLKTLECPNCQKVGYVIGTGEPLDEEEE